jgi:putative sigma-54 modulation protein
MKTTFTARHFHASERLQAYAHEAVAKLQKFFDGPIDADVVLEPDEDLDNPQRATITMQVSKAVLVAEEKAKTYEMALNACVDNLKRQLIKHKEKLARV